ncbi:MAG: ParB/RepB/Spo0J family partition protein [Dissulfurimicrobium sp.]|uniref:ParB/RepB/Spo0J family partition protein n=1 Tax=Dissulfurimicrobium sp. TaxID=2022436 RepID=UPI00404B411F
MKLKGGLGKGLGALISEGDIYDASSPGFFLCPIEKVRPNPNQPRKEMKGAALEDLAASIREKGVLQPLVVREVEGGGYEIIAGERRWRAAQMAGLKTVPVVIKDVSPDEVLELALIENIQRQDLNPLEEAMAYKRLVDELGLTQAQVSSRVGRDRATVANFLRLLQLPDYAQQDLLDGRLTMGHARALLMVDNEDSRRKMRDQIVSKGLSVRQAEDLARRLLRHGAGRKARQPSIHDPDIEGIAKELSTSLGLTVKISHGQRGGRVEIRYKDLDEFNRIIGQLRQIQTLYKKDI